MPVHELKCWPEPFEAIRSGIKRHEIRRFDRPFLAGDALLLREFNPTWVEIHRDVEKVQPGYTGRELYARVLYITAPGTWGIPEGICVMSIRVEVEPDWAGASQTRGEPGGPSEGEPREP